MSLRTLPDEPLAKIAAYLNHTDRHSLSMSHPTFARTFSKANKGLWHDIYTYRYKHRTSQLPTSLHGVSHHERVALHDTADDYLIHHRVPTQQIFPNECALTKEHVLRLESKHAPNVVVVDDDVIHVTHARSYRKVRRARHGFRSFSAGILDADATALAASQHHVATGLRNGLVMTRNVADDSPWRRMRGHTGPVLSLALLDQSVVVSGGVDKTIRVRRTTTRKSTHHSSNANARSGTGAGAGACTLRGHAAGVVWLGACGAGMVASHGGVDGRVKLWDVHAGKCVSTGRMAGGAVHDAAIGKDGVMYAACGPCVQVLDRRVGLAHSVCTLSLPHGWRDGSDGTVGRLRACDDGALCATVGGGGVAMWDARGTWDARGLGWPQRWHGVGGKKLRALCVAGRCVMAGGGARELLTFARHGGYEGFVCEDVAHKGGVTDIAAFQSGFVVSRVGWQVHFVDVDHADVDWRTVQRVVREERGDNVASHRFWDV